MRNSANFYKSKQKSQNWDFYWKCMSLKFTGELCVMTMMNDAKFEKKLTCQFKIDMRNLTNFDLSSRKCKFCTLMGCFWLMNIMFELRKYRGVTFDDTQDWYKVWGKLICTSKNDMRNLTIFHQSTWKSQNWDLMASFCLKLKM